MDWSPAHLVTLGYCAIRPRLSPVELASRRYLVCSPASCLVDEPPGWPTAAALNAVWLCDDLGAVDALLADDDREHFLRLALRGLPAQFGTHPDRWEPTWPAHDVRPAPIPAHFVRLGYDVCSRYAQSTLEHSPLSCNGFAHELGANRYCLFETLTEAVAAARRFAAEGTAEAGPYVVLEVWAEHVPMP